MTTTASMAVNANAAFTDAFPSTLITLPRKGEGGSSSKVADWPLESAIKSQSRFCSLNPGVSPYCDDVQILDSSTTSITASIGISRTAGTLSKILSTAQSSTVQTFKDGPGPPAPLSTDWWTYASSTRSSQYPVPDRISISSVVPAEPTTKGTHSIATSTTAPIATTIIPTWTPVASPTIGVGPALPSTLPNAKKQIVPILVPCAFITVAITALAVWYIFWRKNRMRGAPQPPPPPSPSNTSATGLTSATSRPGGGPKMYPVGHYATATRFVRGNNELQEKGKGKWTGGGFRAYRESWRANSRFLAKWI